MSRLERSAALALCSAALVVGGGSNGEAVAASRSNVRVMVLDCYTGSTDVQVFVDGRQLALTLPPQRNDSIGVCYGRHMTLGSRVHIRVRSAGGDRRIELVPNARARFLLITPSHKPYAELSRNAPQLD